MEVQFWYKIIVYLTGSSLEVEQIKKKNTRQKIQIFKIFNFKVCVYESKEQE